MIPYFTTLSVSLFYSRFIFGDSAADYEEGGRLIILLQSGQNGLCASGRTVIIGETYHLFPAVDLSVTFIIFAEVIYAFVQSLFSHILGFLRKRITGRTLYQGVAF